MIKAFRRFFAAAAKESSGARQKGKGPGKGETPPERAVHFVPAAGQKLDSLDIFAKGSAPVIAADYPSWVYSDVDRIYGPRIKAEVIYKSIPDRDLSNATPEQVYDLKRALKREATNEIRRSNRLSSKS